MPKLNITTTNNLIVPINVQALCVGKGNDLSARFIKADYSFDKLPYKSTDTNNASISEAISSKLFADTINLKSGVHIHWTLPDVLKKGSSKDGVINFPVVPNRWLVTRMENGNANTAKSWVVESDYLSTKEGDRPYYATVPYGTGGKWKYGDQLHRFMGRVVESEKWKPMHNPNDEYYSSLTSLGYGSLTFANSYSNCSSVFGFYDELQNVPDGTLISYVISGWYSDGSKDFLQVLKPQFETEQNNRKESNLNPLKFSDWLGANYNWYFKEIPLEDGFFNDAVSLYSGLVKNIKWNSKQDYIKKPDFITQKDISIAFAPTNIEAFSALLVKNLGNTNLTDILNTLQLGMLKFLDEKNANYIISQALNAKSFQHTNGGTVYSIEKKLKSETDKDNQPLLPNQITDQLNTLNLYQNKVDKQSDLIHSMKWRVFVDWYKYMRITHYDDDESIKKFRETMDEAGGDYDHDTAAFIFAEISKIKDLQGELVNYQIKVTAIKQALQAGLDNIKKDYYQIKQNPGPRYYSPADPVLLLASKDVNWDYAGERNKPAQGGKILCRASSQLLPNTGTVFNVPDVNFKADLIKILQESLLLIKDQQVNIGVSPENFAVQDWGNNNPWLPLTLQYQISYQDLAKNSSTSSYPQNYIIDKFELDDNEQLVTKDNMSDNFTDTYNYNGSIILTPSARFNIVEKIKNELNYTIDEDLKKSLENIIARLKDFSVLSQSLSGFQEHLLMQKKTLQLQVFDSTYVSGNGKILAENVAGIVSGKETTTSPLPQNAFNPIQTGRARINKIWLVDAFGQYVEISSNSDIIYPSDMHTYPSNPGESSWLKLANRLNQPSQLSFRFLSADNEAQEMGISPISNTICGWVVHNRIEESLMFYDKTGEPIGSLKSGVRIGSQSQIVTWRSAPSVGDFCTGSDDCFNGCFEGKNLHLKNFADAMKKKSVKDFKEILGSIENALVTIEPQGYASSLADVMMVSRPLALIQASVQLVLQGLPHPNVSWDAFKTDINNSNTLARSCDKFNNVLFPVKIGDHHNFEDGVVGYFTQNGPSCAINYSNFHTIDDNISNFENCPVKLRPYAFALDEKDRSNDMTLGQNIALLVDPRGSINAITGILPIKTINIPEDQYIKALKSIYVTFFTGPVISSLEENKSISIPISIEHGNKWSWVELETNTNKWVEKSVPQTLDDSIFNHPIQAFEGWLKLQTDEKKVN
jgi:hypothetical protein